MADLQALKLKREGAEELIEEYPIYTLFHTNLSVGPALAKGLFKH